VPTLSQVIRSASPSSSQDERSSPASRISISRNLSQMSDANDDNGTLAAGRPSNWSENRTSYAGRRSRRNSISEADSQLTVENFGGSQDNLNRLAIGKNPDKQPAIVTEQTVTPVRHPRRQTSVEPADYQYKENPHLYSGSAERALRTDDVSMRSNEDSSSSGDVVFYGRKKQNHAFDAEFDNRRSRERSVDNVHSQSHMGTPTRRPSYQHDYRSPQQVQDDGSGYVHDRTGYDRGEPKKRFCLCFVEYILLENRKKGDFLSV